MPRIKHTSSYRNLALGALLAWPLVLSPINALAQGSQRWYQIEVSIFSHDSGNASEELFAQDSLSIAYPNRVNKLRQLSDVLQLSDWSVLTPTNADLPRNTEQQQDAALQPIKAMGPRPFVASDSFTMPDIARESFIYLPVGAHDFLGTNRALERAPNYRLLDHKAWRQPMLHDNRDTAIAIAAGRQFGNRRELEGSLRLYFNRAEDRVVFEPNIWLTSFSIVNNASFKTELPTIPTRLRESNASDETAETTQFFVNHVTPMHQTREMRSNEFHYIDHPSLGILIQIAPYSPPAPLPPAAIEQAPQESTLAPTGFQ